VSLYTIYLFYLILENSINLQSIPSYRTGYPPSYNSGDLLQSVYPPSYNTLDLVQPEQVYIPSYQNTINSCLEDSINLQSIPSFLNQSNINCCLENSMNLNYILLNIIFIVVLIIIFYLRTK